MKNLILTTLVLISTMTFAAPNAEKKAERVAKRKAGIIARISQRIDSLEKNKSCISSASSKDDFKQCRSEHKARMKALKNKFKGERSARKAEREARKAARKAKKQ